MVSLYLAPPSNSRRRVGSQGLGAQARLPHAMDIRAPTLWQFNIAIENVAL